jgi:hypothetical protein
MTSVYWLTEQRCSGRNARNTFVFFIDRSCKAAADFLMWRGRIAYEIRTCPQKRFKGKNEICFCPLYAFYFNYFSRSRALRHKLGFRSQVYRFDFTGSGCCFWAGDSFPWPQVLSFCSEAESRGLQAKLCILVEQLSEDGQNKYKIADTGDGNFEKA